MKKHANPRCYRRRSLDESSREMLRALMARLGCERTASRLGSSAPTLEAAASGLPLLKRTALRLEQEIEVALEAEALTGKVRVRWPANANGKE